MNRRVGAWSRRAFLVLLGGVGAGLSPLGADARRRKPPPPPPKPKPIGVYANTYTNVY